MFPRHSNDSKSGRAVKAAVTASVVRKSQYLASDYDKSFSLSAYSPKADLFDSASGNSYQRTVKRRTTCANSLFSAMCWRMLVDVM